MGYTTSPLDKVESLSAKQSHSPQSRVTFRKAESLIRHRKVESLFAKQSHSDLRNVESAANRIFSFLFLLGPLAGGLVFTSESWKTAVPVFGLSQG
ncbi:hypothetical protein BaRGS_00035900 [Batillaria attramentaria]|uniref:Uncharacterized protein n=1 Tax=Batillaria attramentaria TaxID=370345 RepID=A0ABD0JDH9_9CAEN